MTAADRMIESIQALPWGVHAVMALLAVAGVVLWSAGRSVLKPAVVLTAAAAAALAGFMILPAIAPESGLSPYWGSAGGVVIGLLAGLILFRVAVAMIFGLIAAVVCGLVGSAIMSATWSGLTAPPAAALEVSGSGGEEQRAVQRGERWVQPVDDAAEDPVIEPDEGPMEEPAQAGVTARPVAEPVRAPAAPPSVSPRDPLHGLRAAVADPDHTAASARAFLAALGERVSAQWQGLSGAERAVIGFGMAVGLCAGGLVGLLMPAWAAGAITAMAGAAIWLPALVWLAQAFDVPGRQHLELPATGWAIVWAVAALLGVAIQWAGLAKANAQPTRAPGKRKAAKAGRA